MMAESVKLLSNTASFTTANTVFNAGSVILTVTELTLVTQRSNTNVVLASVVLDKGSYILRKGRDDTLEANVVVYASKVAV